MKSFYKARIQGSEPVCAICGGPGKGRRALHHLTHGVSVWLCAGHRSEEFQRRRGGRDFVVSLDAVWKAAGSMTKRHHEALLSHLRRVRPRPDRHRPGSYSWPELRVEAEGRFAAGESPDAVIQELRRANAAGKARVPTTRTMRRWFSEARWLVATVVRASRPRTTTASGRRPIAERESGRRAPSSAPRGSVDRKPSGRGPKVDLAGQTTTV